MVSSPRCYGFHPLRSAEGCAELELDGDEVTRERFLLPKLQSRLEKCAFDVHYGSGLCIIRGLNNEDYTVEDSTVIFLALASYVGDQRGLQNSKGDMLCRPPVHDISFASAKANKSTRYRVKILDRA